MSRKIYCLLLAFVLVLSVSCVAASDANQTAATLTQADETDGIQKVTYENTISNESTSETNGEQYTMDLKSNIDDYGTLTANVTVNESVKGNITFSINYTGNEIYNQTVAIENGSASFSGYATNASGTYIVTATYTGDANLTSKTINKILMITRNSPDLEIVSKIINDMGNIQVNITLNRNATGNITLAFNDTKKIIEIVNGTAILENYILEKGNYTMQAYYDGDRDYFKAVKNDTLKVEKSTTELRIDSLVSETGMMDIEAFVNENATGNITITITNANGTTIQTTQQTAINGTVILDPIFVENNTYIINATYTGDDNYYKATNTTNIEITKKQTNIIITSVKVDDLGNINVIIKIDENATGNITLTFNDTEETLEIINGTATLENYRLAKGNYTITATYPENENYFKGNANEIININKNTTELTINILVSETGMMDITAYINENATGNITITITDANGTTIQTTQQTTINGTVIPDPIFVENNTYTINATYTGDNNYYKATNSINIEITKKQAKLNITSVKVDDLGNISVNITIDENATGNITLAFNDNEVTIPIANGTATLENYRLAKGNYTITATYPENENYFKAIANETLDVKHTPELSINVESDEYGVQTVTLTIDENATGNITLYIIGNTSILDFEKAIENGTVIFNNITLEKDNYTFIAEYEGDDNYYKANATDTFNVTKSVPTLESIATVYDNVIVVNTNITNTTTGNVTYRFLLNGTEVRKVSIAINGTDASYIDTQIFQKGNYTVIIEYPGDENYYKANTTVNATIAKNTPEITINITTDEYGTTTISANSTAPGNITIDVFDSTSQVIISENNTYIGQFQKGNYTIIAIYPENDEYFTTAEQKTFEIAKSIANITANTTVTDNIIVIKTEITNTTTGNVTYTFLINGTVIKQATVAINGTDASYTDKILQKGNYTIIVEYPGDENYYKANTTVNATIAKNTPEITINITTDEYGTTTISANSTAPGNITIDVFDSTSQVIISENNTYIGQFQKGNYTIIAIYPENDEYFTTAEQKTFEIAKSIANITANTTVTDNIIVIKTEITNTTTGNVTYTFLINGTVIKQATVAINGTDASYTDKILQKGNYTILIEYAGDENYYKTNTTLNATIAKNTPEITIEITTDEYGTTTITAKANVTGNITLELLNTTVNNTYTGKIAKGNYTIVATSPEDEENFQSVKNATLIISKDIPAMNAILTMDENIVFIETAMYENATGNVTYAVYRNGTFIKEESVEIINGIAKFTDRLVKGQYDFFIEYQGDDNYFKANTTLNTSVDKVMPEINYSVEINGKNVIIYVNIENATGIVEYSSAIDKYNKTLSKGSTLFNGTYPAGNNTVTLKYYGDDANFKTTKEIAFFIKQSTTVKAGSVSVIYANTTKVTVTLTGENGPINNATVQITFNGKTYKAKTGSNGKVTISVSGSVLPKSYTCTVKFAGDNTSLASSGKFKITVKKATPKIVASKKTYKVSTKIKKYTVTLKNHKNKPIKKNKVSLKVNGKTYKVTTNTKGQAIFKITNLKKSAKFIALIKYTGNNYYNTVSKKVILTVKR